MLGVTRLPPWFEQAFTTFEPAFSDSRNADSFKHLVSALILGETQWTISGLSQGISRPDGNAKSRRAYDYFFGGADWSPADLAQYHAEYVFDQLQVGDVYVPYLARMYVPEDLAPDFDEPFKEKTEIAVEDIVTPLQLEWSAKELTPSRMIVRVPGKSLDGAGMKL